MALSQSAQLEIDPSRLRIDSLCDAFERRWRSNGRVRIEDVHDDNAADDDTHGALLELLLLEMELRRGQGDVLQAEEYYARFPTHREIVDRAFTWAKRSTIGGQLKESSTVTSPLGGPGTARDEPVDSPAAFELPGYTILGEVGSGGMGLVYQAQQDRLGRKVALKTIRSGALASTEEINRFLSEANTAAQLDHSNIVPIHEIGERDGLHYFSMGFVDGRTLQEVLADGVFSPVDAASLVRTLAEAVAYAHDQGIIHRDLKPGNVMLDPGGKPKITDFGLAKQIETDSAMTATGQVLGTPSYMPPEQATGETSRVGPHSDVYSLGAILYALLTGRPPFQAANMMETLKQVVERDPVSPRQLNPEVDRDLETICLKCLEKESEKRYASSHDLAEDLGRWLRREPIQARSIGRIERTARWCRRNPLVATLSGTVVLLFLGGLLASAGLTTWALHEADRADEKATEYLTQKRAADAARQDSDDKREQIEDLLRESYIAEARARRDSRKMGQRFDALTAIRAAAEIRTSEELRDEAIACLALPDLRVAHRWHHPGYQRPYLYYVGAFWINSDVTRYARREEDGGVSIRRVADDQEVVNLSGFGAKNDSFARFSPDDRWIAVGYRPGPTPIRICIWDISRAEPVYKLEESTVAYGVDFSPDSRTLAIVNRSEEVALFSLDSGEFIDRIPGAEKPYGLSHCPTRPVVAVSSLIDELVRVIDLTSRKVVQVLAPNKGARNIAWHPDGVRLAVSCDGTVNVWNTVTGKMEFQFETGAVNIDVAYSHAGDLLATGGWDNVLRIWDTIGGELLLSTRTKVTKLQFSRDGRRLGGGLEGPDFLIYEVEPAEELRRLAFGAAQSISRNSEFVSVGFQGRRGGPPRSAGIVELASGTVHRVTPQPDSSIRFFPEQDGFILREYATGLSRWPISRRSAESGEFIQIGPPQQIYRSSNVGSSALSRDGSTLAITHRGTGTGRVFQLDEEDHSVSIQPHKMMAAVTVSPDGRWVATGVWMGGKATGAGVRVWDSRTGQLIADLPVPANSNVRFSADGRTLLTSNGSEYHFWEVGTWMRTHTIPREADGNQHGRMAFSPDGRMLAINISRQTVQLLEASTYRRLATLPGRQTVVDFTQDSSQLVVNGEDRVARIWDLRAVREQLRSMGLDWDLPRYPPPQPAAGTPLRVEVIGPQ